MSPRLIAYLVLAGGILYGIYWFNGVLDERTELREEVKAKKLEISTLETEKKTLVAAVEKASKNSVVYQKQDEVIKNEKTTLTNDLNSGRKLVYVRASCPPSPTSTPGSSGTTNTALRLDAAAQPDYANLVTAIKSNANKYNLCMADNALLRQELGAK